MPAPCRLRAAPSATPSLAGALVERSRVSMGSELRLTAWTTDETGGGAAFEAVFDEFDRLDALMSVWQDGQRIVRAQRRGRRARRCRSARTSASVLRTARQVSEWTGGKFDVTFGALADLWKFDHDQDNRIPLPADDRGAAAARRLPRARASTSAPAPRSCGARACACTSAASARATRSIGRSAILRARGFSDFMIQAGGDLYVGGRRGDRPWRLGIRDPRGPPTAASRRST